jgi:hypothetical protein
MFGLIIHDVNGMIKSRLVIWTCHVASMRHMRNSYRVLGVSRVRKTPHGRPKRRREDNIKRDLK